MVKSHSEDHKLEIVDINTYYGDSHAPGMLSIGGTGMCGCAREKWDGENHPAPLHHGLNTPKLGSIRWRTGDCRQAAA